MRWKQTVESKPYHGQIRHVTKFALLSIKCVNGECVWLEKVNIVEEYRIDSTGHWINKAFMDRETILSY